jgi:hypothetical protein
MDNKFIAVRCNISEALKSRLRTTNDELLRHSLYLTNKCAQSKHDNCLLCTSEEAIYICLYLKTLCGWCTDPRNVWPMAKEGLVEILLGLAQRDNELIATQACQAINVFMEGEFFYFFFMIIIIIFMVE